MSGYQIGWYALCAETGEQVTLDREALGVSPDDWTTTLAKARMQGRVLVDGRPFILVFAVKSEGKL